MKPVIINAAIGEKPSCYHKGQQRLIESLKNVEWEGDVLTYQSFPLPLGLFNTKNPYNIKAACLKDAIDLGYTTIIWVDCSMYATNSLLPILNHINEHEFYIESNGWNCAQECSDLILEQFQIDRNQAENILMCSSGLFGVDVTKEKGRSFVNQFVRSAIQNQFDGSRLHDNQSRDVRFLRHRQDQSVASLIISKLEIEMLPLNTFWSYDVDLKNMIFICNGM